MRAPTNTTCALLLYGVTVLPGLLVACGKGSANRNPNVTDTTPAAATTPPTGATAPSAASHGDAVASPAISNWTDNNIVARLEAGDKNEVQLGRLAESKAVIPAVRDFAKTLVTDHSKGERDVRSLEARTKLGAKPASEATTARDGDELLKKFAATPKGTDWDSTFVQHEFAEHRQDIADTKAMQSQAKDSQLKQLLGNELPVLQKHLDAAEKLLGDTPGGSAAWHNAEVRKTERAKSAKAKP
jgi:putative membrane protein